MASRISTPVELLYRQEKILVRRLPGFADFISRKSEPAPFVFGAQIEAFVRRFRMTNCTISKTRSSINQRSKKDQRNKTVRSTNRQSSAVGGRSYTIGNLR